MLSRVANSIYWMTRYLERAENVARFVNVNINLTLELGVELSDQWESLVSITGDRQPFRERYDRATRDNIQRFLMFDVDNPNSVAACLRLARENARSIRESLPAELWEELNKFYHIVRGTDPEAVAQETHDFLELVRNSCQLIYGLMDGCMSRNEAWHFSQLGRLIERADKTSRLLDVKYFLLLPKPADVGTPLDILQWSALLKSASALQMYHRERGRISPVEVVDFIILDRLFPRAVRFCLDHAEQSLECITGSEAGKGNTPAERHLANLLAQFDFSEAEDIVAHGLHEFIDKLQSRLNKLDDKIYETFFAARPLGGGVATAGGCPA